MTENEKVVMLLDIIDGTKKFKDFKRPGYYEEGDPDNNDDVLKEVLGESWWEIDSFFKPTAYIKRLAKDVLARMITKQE
jgi:hypothetical protein